MTWETKQTLWSMWASYNEDVQDSDAELKTFDTCLSHLHVKKRVGVYQFIPAMEKENRFLMAEQHISFYPPDPVSMEVKELIYQRTKGSISRPPSRALFGATTRCDLEGCQHPDVPIDETCRCSQTCVSVMHSLCVLDSKLGVESEQEGQYYCSETCKTTYNVLGDFPTSDQMAQSLSVHTINKLSDVYRGTVENLEPNPDYWKIFELCLASHVRSGDYAADFLRSLRDMSITDKALSLLPNVQNGEFKEDLKRCLCCTPGVPYSTTLLPDTASKSSEVSNSTDGGSDL